MPNLYVTSITPRAGKTAFAAGLRALLAARGKRALYYRPFAEGDASASTEEANFLRGTFGDNGVLAPPQTVDSFGLKEGLNTFAEPLRQRLDSARPTPVIIDGLTTTREAARASTEMAKLAEAQVVGVIRYTRGMDLAPIVALKDPFGQSLKGVILNAVPEHSLRAAAEETVPDLKQFGVNVLGILPEERLLLGFTVSEYSEHLGGRILNNTEQGQNIVESLLVGANALDPGEEYYGRVVNKALITRGDRPDLQFSALNAPTRCLILTHGIDPIPYVLDYATQQEIPLMVVPESTLATIATIEGFVGHPSFHHPAKLVRVVDILAAHLDKSLLNL